MRSSKLLCLSTLLVTMLLLYSANRERTSPAALRLAADGWELSLLDTGSSAPYLSETEKDILLVTNAVRSNPTRFADLYIAEYRSWYKGSRLRIPGQTEMLTAEGITAADECLKKVKASSARPLLSPSEGMSRAAREHAQWQSKSGEIGHTGKGGSDPWSRMDAYGQWQDASGENISYGFDTGFLIVLQLLVDDGVPDRGHRTNILSSDFHVTGLGFATHPKYRFVAVLNYAGGYREK